MNSKPVVGIVGATGAVGVEIMECMNKRGFPVADLALFASPRSAGLTMIFRENDISVKTLDANSFNGLDIVFFSAGGDTSRRYVPLAAEAGATVIDNSSAFRMSTDVPLIVPEVNRLALNASHRIVANPNCSTIIAAMPLWPLHSAFGIERVLVSTYQAASGAGAAGMSELESSTRAFLQGKSYKPDVFAHPYAFNVFSHNSSVNLENGYNEEELKFENETRKIFDNSTFRISATCVRVPVMRAHCESIHVQCVRPVDLDEVRAVLATAPGVKIIDSREENLFPMPVLASGQDDILVGRLRMDRSDPMGSSFWMFVAGDQLLKGAALNAVQIAELRL